MTWMLVAITMLVLLPAFHLAAWLVRDYNCTWSLQEWEAGNAVAPDQEPGATSTQGGRVL
jgi:hypothetical protein